MKRKGIQVRQVQNSLLRPFFDTPKFTRDLETAYKEMWCISLAGNPPTLIEVGTLI